MPTLLVEDPTTLYLILGVAAIACGALWWATRRPRWLIGVATVVSLALLLCLLDFLVVTDGEQITENVRQMAAAVARRDGGSIHPHIARDFRLEHLDRDRFREFVDTVLERRYVNEVTVWEFVTHPAAGNRAHIEFMAKPKGGQAPDNVGYRVIAQFTREPDGKWRMSGFEIRDPMLDQVLHIPLLPAR